MNKKYQALVLSVILILSSSCGSDDAINTSSESDSTSIDIMNENNSDGSTDGDNNEELEKEMSLTAAEIYAHTTPEIDYDNSPLANPVIYSARLNGYYLDITTEGFIFRYDQSAPGKGCRYAIVGDIVPEGKYSINLTNLNNYDPLNENGFYILSIEDYMHEYSRQSKSYMIMSEYQFLSLMYTFSAETYIPNESIDKEIMKRTVNELPNYEIYLNDNYFFGYIHEDGRITEITLNEDGTVDGLDGSGEEFVINLEEGQQIRGNNIEFKPVDPSLFNHVEIIEKALDSEEAAKSKIAINEDLIKQDLGVSVSYYSANSSTYYDTDIIKGSTSNHTSIDIKDITIAFMAWDCNGLPLQISELNSGNESYVLEKTFEGINVAVNDYMKLEVSLETNNKIRAVTAIWVSYTDFYDNTYENPLYQEFLDEYEAKPNK